MNDGRGCGPAGTIRLLVALATVALPEVASAHDTWVEVSANVVRPGDVVHIDLLLGNHGNEHRDFKIAGKLGSLAGTTLDVVGPGGARTDLVPRLVDVGLAPDEGFWSGRFVATAAGLHCVAHTRAGVRHGARGLKSAKTYFLVAEETTAPARPGPAVIPPLGHPLELVLESQPVLGCCAGREIAVRLLHHGRPLAGERVSFIPRGAVLAAGFDPEYERTTDAEGRCRFTPRDGNLLLVAAHRSAPEEKGDGYEKTSYAATLLIDVPQRCPGSE